MTNLNGLAWGYKVTADELNCYYFYNSSSASSILDPRALLIHRPGVAYHDWEADFYPHVPINHTGTPVIWTNEPDNNYIKPGGEPAGDNLSPENAVIFLANAIRRWPNVWFVGPNIVRQDNWLDRFLQLWQAHGYPLTGRKSPFKQPNGAAECWGCHVYGNGVNYARDYVEWFTNKVTSFGHKVDYLWVSEYGTHKADEMESWTRYFKNYNKRPLWFAVFSPWIKDSQPLKDAYRRGML